MSVHPSATRLSGLLLGTAVGDALGLPAEGLSRRRQSKWWPGVLRHRFFCGRGMLSDDTEHAFMTAQALLTAGDDWERFRQSLAWQLRWWFLALPAGVGLATARSCLRLWLGVPAERSGVHSAGNGPAMRSAIIGAFYATGTGHRHKFVRASTRLTHLDPRAETAAVAVAEAAAFVCRDAATRERAGNPAPAPGFVSADNGGDAIQLLMQIPADAQWRELCAHMKSGLERGDSTPRFAETLGLHHGVTGFAYHTVPVALYAWLRHRGAFEAALHDAVRCGGDTDTVGAICGALAGCDVGVEGIPGPWLDGLHDWPRSRRLLSTTADQLASPNGKPVHWFWPGILPRNLFFLLVVLLHGFRRLFPPY